MDEQIKVVLSDPEGSGLYNKVRSHGAMGFDLAMAGLMRVAR
jgi:hypothetical protein